MSYCVRLSGTEWSDKVSERGCCTTEVLIRGCPVTTHPHTEGKLRIFDRSCLVQVRELGRGPRFHVEGADMLWWAEWGGASSVQAKDLEYQEPDMYICTRNLFTIPMKLHGGCEQEVGALRRNRRR